MKLFFVLVLLLLLVGVVNADTLIVYPEYDAKLSRSGVNQTFYSLRDGAGTSLDSSNTVLRINVYSDTGTNLYQSVGRTAITFNTTSISSGNTINSAKINLTPFGSDATTNLSTVSFSPANKLSYVTGDFATVNWGSTLLTTNWTEVSGVQEKTITDNTVIVKGGLTVLGFRTNWDMENKTPVWSSGKLYYRYFYSMDEAGTTRDPVLTITYTPPDTTPPASITNLANTTNCYQINWTWTKPTDSDFDHTVIYKNNVWLKNVTNTTTHDLWSPLTALTAYTFSSQTCDITGNCNQTFVNMTATTTECPPFAVSFTANKTCGNVPLDIQFNDTSIGSPTTWNWSFGDGNVSTTQNPVFRYNTTGLYSVNLSANHTISSGWSNKTDYIRVIPNWAVCTATPTPTPTWGPAIMPTTDNQPFSWVEFLVSLWWLWLLIVLFLILVRR